VVNKLQNDKNSPQICRDILADRSIEQNLFNKGITAIAGIDEAGRGPLAGPVVAAAAILPPNVVIPGLDDSKKLTEKKRESLYEAITNSDCIYSVQFVTADIIDEIGIKPATHLAMRAAANEVAAHCEYLLIDGNDNVAYEMPHEYIIKGDALCDCIAAASILAKVSRDRYMLEMAQEYPQYGFESHKGYGTAYHIAAIREHGLCPLHRRSFMTAKVLGC